MLAKLISVEGTKVKIELTIELSESMLESEGKIQESLNEAGCIATRESMKHLDRDGSAIELGGKTWRTKGQQEKSYQTPYGEVVVARHVYQSAGGGKTYCPMERNARIIVTSTPMFAKQISSKMANGVAREVKRDLRENHGREVALSYIQNLSEAVGSIVQAKEEGENYEPPEIDVKIESVGIGLDGTCMLMCENGWREAMVGTISLYDGEGERQHTIYLGATPEYGRKRFLERLEREISQTKARYPKATYVGIADGAESNWKFLNEHTEEQILDFYHASGYLGILAEVLHPKQIAEQEQWLKTSCHQLKHELGSAENLYKQMVKAIGEKELTETVKEKLQASITYFRNHLTQMDYAQFRQKDYPIGSGVTEAACKTLVKQRLCCSGMRWKEKGASIILSLRALVLTSTRWEQFWNKLNQYGFPVAV
ncbi:MAG: ISKra4 family transposase [Pseudanabaena sp.]|jgi:hypothetical protein